MKISIVFIKTLGIVGEMKVWVHKKTGELAITRHMWFESDEAVSEDGDLSASFYSQAVCFENKNGVMLVFPVKVLDEFEEVGDL